MQTNKTLYIGIAVALVVVAGVILLIKGNSASTSQLNEVIIPKGVVTQATTEGITEDSVTFNLQVNKITMDAKANKNDFAVESGKKIVLVDVAMSYAEANLFQTANFYLANKSNPSEKVAATVLVTVDNEFKLNTSAGLGVIPFIVNKDWARNDLELVLMTNELKQADEKEVVRVSLVDVQGQTYSENTVQTLTNKSVTLKSTSYGTEGQDEFKVEVLSITRNVKDASKFSNPYPVEGEEVVGVEVKVTNLLSTDEAFFGDFSLKSKFYSISGKRSESSFPYTDIVSGESLTKTIYYKMSAMDSKFELNVEPSGGDTQVIVLE